MKVFVAVLSAGNNLTTVWTGNRRTMNASLIAVACGLIPLGAAAASPPQTTIGISLQYAGTNQTVFSWSISGYLASPGGQTLSANINDVYDISGYFAGLVNDLGANTNYIALSGFGSLTDLNSGASQQFEGLQFDNAGKISLFLGDFVSAGQPYTPLLVSGGDQLRYTAGADTTVIDVPITAFNPGTYQYESLGEDVSTQPDTTIFTSDVIVNLSVGTIPEPSTLLLASSGSGLLVLTMLLRRRGWNSQLPCWKWVRIFPHPFLPSGNKPTRHSNVRMGRELS
jgi:hypothetical protein